MTLPLKVCTSCWCSRVDEAGAPCAGCNGRGVTGGRALSLAPPVLPTACDASRPCGACADCDLDDADDDAPSAADLHRADSEELDRELSRMAWSRR